MARKEPQNIDAEINALGSAFLSVSVLDKICEELTEDMFFSKQNQILYKVIKLLHTKEIPIDATTVINELEKSDELSKVGGVEYITEVLSSVASVANIQYYVNIIFEKYILRTLINKTTEIQTDCYEEKEEVDQIVEDAEKSILSVNNDRLGKEIMSIQDILPEVQANIEELAKNKGKVTGVSTGFYELDKITRGFQPHEVIIIAGRPGGGKSALALNIATNVAINEKKSVALFSLEMGAEELAKRMFSSVGQIESDNIKTGKLNNNDWKKLNEAISELADTKLFLDDTAGITVGEIRRKCRRIKNSSSGLDLIVIDYLQLISSSAKYAGNRVQEVSEVSRDLKKLAMEMNVPVIALAQLSRSSEARKGDERKPRLSDLRESGSIEQDADIVSFIYSDDYYDNISAISSEVQVIVAKNRSGSTGIANLLFEKNMGSFKNYKTREENE